MRRKQKRPTTKLQAAKFIFRLVDKRDQTYTITASTQLEALKCLKAYVEAGDTIVILSKEESERKMMGFKL